MNISTFYRQLVLTNYKIVLEWDNNLFLQIESMLKNIVEN